MTTRRMARVASMIREVVSDAILKELRDPRIRNVTVLGAQVSPDLRHASVSVSILGDEKMAALSMHGLNSARGYLQSRVADCIKSRYTPELRFVLDDGIRKSIATSAILRELQGGNRIAAGRTSGESLSAPGNGSSDGSEDSLAPGDSLCEQDPTDDET